MLTVMKEPRQTIISQVGTTDPKGFQRAEKLLQAKSDLAAMLDFSVLDKGECKGCASNIQRESCLQSHQAINHL